MYKIDGTPYSYAGKFSCGHGSGDDSESWEYLVLQTSGGEQCLFLKEGSNHYLYRLADIDYDESLVETIHESSEVERCDVAAWEGVSRIDWASLEEPFSDAPAPFTNTREAMIVQTPSQPKVYMTVPLTPLSGTQSFASARLPASSLVRTEVKPINISAAAKFIEIGAAFLLAIILGYGILTADTRVMTALWWLGPLATVFCWLGGRGPFYAANHLISGSFLLYFCTHGIDNLVGAEWESEQLAAFECGHVLLCLLTLLALRFLHFRTYITLLSATIIGGGCSWLAFTAMMLVASAEEEFNYFDFYSWYAGSWGWLWPIILIGMFCYKRSDYRHAPLERKSLRSSLFKLSEALKRDFSSIGSEAPSIAGRCNDLSDGLKLSSDPALIQLFHYAESFDKLHGDFKLLQKADVKDEQDQKLVENSLKTVAEDIDQVIEQFRHWGEPEARYQSLRFSPFLRTLEL